MDNKIVVESCATVYFFAVLVEFILRRHWLRACLELTVLFSLLIVDLLLHNSLNGTVSLGEGQSPMWPVVIMFVAVILGTMARYFFYKTSPKLSWLGLLKPMMISPIVLIPLIGSMQTFGNLSGMQVVSFGLLAFQNGFFWQAALDSVRPMKRRRIS